MTDKESTKKPANPKVEFELSELQTSLWANTVLMDQQGNPVNTTPTDVAKKLFLDWLRQNANLE